MIPEYLTPYIVQQDASLYTPMDHASWRFILKLSQDFFAGHAHKKYLDGLRETGVSTERIPLIAEMDAKLRKFGWRAVAVSGFIPPAVFMEFLSLGILPIACDMRTLEHLAYTPAPDIVHEAAGHAPIIADPGYASYLKHYGELARKAIFSSKDQEVYEAIRSLSDIKEDPRSTAAQIEASQVRLDQASASVDYVSEATQLARMSWWTIEYGLIGDAQDPKSQKIYGAGLLSSLGESFHCLGPKVKRVPFTLDCIEQTYDITRPQPQLYVARDFEQLAQALEEMSKRMAFRLGGIEALDRARKAGTVTTTELDTGLQISGKLQEYVRDSAGNLAFVKYSGPVQLAFSDREIDGQGALYHSGGYSSPLGKVKGLSKDLTQLSLRDLDALGFGGSSVGRLEFESGIVLEARFRNAYSVNGVNLILTFEDCRIVQGARILYQPEWGPFDLACGSAVKSVFGGPADRRTYLEATGGFKQEPRFPKTNLTPENKRLNELYARLRTYRENHEREASVLAAVHDELERSFTEDWLLRYELLELNTSQKLETAWEKPLRERLERISASSAEKAEMISRGLALLSTPA